MSADNSGQRVAPAGGQQPPPQAGRPLGGPSEPTASTRWLRFAVSAAVGAALVFLVVYLDGRRAAQSACESDDQCPKGQYCRSDVCEELPAYGQECAPGDRCADGLRCRRPAQICADPTPTADGQACSHSFQCGDESFCNENHVCSPRQHENAPTAAVPSR